MYNQVLRLLFLFSFICLHYNIKAQSNTIDWSVHTIAQSSGYSHNFTLSTGENMTVSYQAPYNLNYETNSSFNVFGPVNDSCIGSSNSLGHNEDALILHDGYQSDITSAIAGKTLTLSWAQTITDVQFNIYDITSIILSWWAPRPEYAIYNDMVVIEGIDESDNIVYPTLSEVTKVYSRHSEFSADQPVCSYLGDTYDDHPSSSSTPSVTDNDFAEHVVDNTVTPPHAYVSGGSLYSGSVPGIDSDCAAVGALEGLDISVDFGSLVLKEVRVTYKNYDNSTLYLSTNAAFSDCSDSLATSTGIATQNILIGDINYSSDELLPVELVDFNVINENNNALLTWKTESETNNSYFEVEFSHDGSNFEKVGVVDGAGNSSSKQEYQFLHKGVGLGFNKIAYYRLKQVNFDGKYNYGHLKGVRFDNRLHISNFHVDIYPNPGRSLLNIIIPRGDDQKKKFQVSIKDTYGRSVSNYSYIPGQPLDISNLPKGMYALFLFSEDEKLVWSEKVIKM